MRGSSANWIRRSVLFFVPYLDRERVSSRGISCAISWARTSARKSERRAGRSRERNEKRGPDACPCLGFQINANLVALTLGVLCGEGPREEGAIALEFSIVPRQTTGIRRNRSVREV